VDRGLAQLAHKSLQKLIDFGDYFPESLDFEMRDHIESLQCSESLECIESLERDEIL